MAPGKYLRVQVRIDISKPLMRGVTLDMGEGVKGHWCRFEYEYLPDFCYRCGFLDHVDKDCKITLGRDETPQFGSWLKAYIPRHNSDLNRGGRESRRAIDSRVAGSNRRFDFNNNSARWGRESENWRQHKLSNLLNVANEKENLLNGANEKESGEINILKGKIVDGQTTGGSDTGTQQLLLKCQNNKDAMREKDQTENEPAEVLHGEVPYAENPIDPAGVGRDGAAMQIEKETLTYEGSGNSVGFENHNMQELHASLMHVDPKHLGIASPEKSKPSRYKKLQSVRKQDGAATPELVMPGTSRMDRKRGLEESEDSVAPGKKKRTSEAMCTEESANSKDEAGLPVQPCRSQ
ncbi:hypothetical protein ZWY2020_044642 [Hordeum vulgare]|nr:hypothetical protein ZWY2020_044642 [Hordeum vulgare]